jgi:hypothetical protein
VRNFIPEALLKIILVSCRYISAKLPIQQLAFGKGKVLAVHSVVQGFSGIDLECFISFSYNFLSIPKYSTVAKKMAKLMGESHVKELKIEDISLGEYGFRSLMLHMPRRVTLSHINVR